MGTEQPTTYTIKPGQTVLVTPGDKPVEVRAEECPPVRPEPRWPRVARPELRWPRVAQIMADDRRVGLLRYSGEPEALTLDEATGLLSSSTPEQHVELELSVDPADAKAHTELVEAAKAGGGNVDLQIPAAEDA